MNKDTSLLLGRERSQRSRKVSCKTGSGQGPAVVCSCDLSISAEGTFLQRLHCVSAGAAPSTRTIEREVGHTE